MWIGQALLFFIQHPGRVPHRLLDVSAAERQVYEWPPRHPLERVHRCRLVPGFQRSTRVVGRYRHVAGPFDMRTAPDVRGFFVGDYEALAHVDGSFLPFFVIANSGNLNNRTDVFATTITP